MKPSPMLPDKHRIARRTRRGGSVLVMMSLAITVIFGCAAIAIDYGVLVRDANELQRGCDAAAVAGAQKLYSSGSSAAHLVYDRYDAREFAVTVAARNGVTVDPNDVTFPAPNKIKVLATRTRSLFFAQVLGRKNGTVTRDATAGRIALRGVPRAVPLAMTTDDYYTNRGGNSFEYQLINNHDTNFASRTVVALDLRVDNSGKSPAVFQDDMTNGYNDTIYLGQDINNALNADLASQGQKLEIAINDRIQRAAAAPYNDTGSNFTYPNYPADDPRIILLIVAPPTLASNNNPTLNAQFFVPVYIESMQRPDGKAMSLRLRILPTTTYSSQDPLVVLDSSGANITGPSVVSLLG